MEEIDIIELLKRVKEKREPMIIKAKYTLFYLQEIRADDEPIEIGNMYLSEENVSLVDVIDVNTKIKILDKSDEPVIEEINYRYFANLLETTESEKRICACLRELGDKINKTIRYINKEEK